MANRPKVPSRVRERLRKKAPSKAPASLARTVAEELAATVPSGVYADPAPPTDRPSGFQVLETFFSRRGKNVTPGVGYDGIVLNHRHFVNTPMGEDADGNPVPLAEFRFGVNRAGHPERNLRGGYVVARRNPDTMELDPDGEPVQIDAGSGETMTLLVRKKEHGDARRAHLAEMGLRMAKQRHREAAETIADGAGLAENVQITDKSHETVGPQPSA